MKHQHEFSKKGGRAIKGAFIIRSTMGLSTHAPTTHPHTTHPSLLPSTHPSIHHSTHPLSAHPSVCPFTRPSLLPSNHHRRISAPPTLPTSIRHPPAIPPPILSSIFLTRREPRSCARNILKSPEKNPRNLRGGKKHVWKQLEHRVDRDNVLNGNGVKTRQPERKGTKHLELGWTAEKKQGRESGGK